MVRRRLDGRTPPQEPHEVPEGCSPSAHGVLGRCSGCPGTLLGDEVIAWRVFAGAHLDALRALAAADEA